jgi:hypothetical protein
MSTPYIKLWRLNPSSNYPIVEPASVKRDYLDATYKSHAYHCQPLTTATLHGWDFLMPHDVEVIWDGVNDPSPSHIKILTGGCLEDGTIFAGNETGNTTITFHLQAILETDIDHYLLLSGSPFVEVNGALPMDALLRSDWYHHTPLQYSWRLTVPNVPVLFKKGTPFLRIINYPIGLLEKTDIILDTATDEQKAFMHNYNAGRDKFYSDNPDFKFGNMYKKTTKSTDPNAPTYLNEPYRPHPKKPIIK